MTKKLVYIFLICLSLSTFNIINGEHAIEEDENNERDGRFLHPKIWRNIREGIQESFDAIERITPNLEKTFTSLLSRGFGREDTGGLPRPLSDEPIDVDAVGGELGFGIDDGLKVYFEGDEQNRRTDSAFEGTDIKRSEYPEPEGGFDTGLEADYYPPNRPRPVPFNPFRNIFNGGDIFNIFRSPAPWWKRQNVCMDLEEIDETESDKEVEAEEEVEATPETTEAPLETGRGFISASFEVQSCSDDGFKYTCVRKLSRNGIHKTIRKTYRCCHGFVRDAEGCDKVELFPMPETLKSLEGASDFSVLLTSAGVLDSTADRNLTIFVPSDEAVEEYTAALEEENQIQGEGNDILRRARRSTFDTKELLQGHMVEGFYFASELEDELKLATLNEKSSIRVNVYSGKPSILTANCARIISANKHSKNGVVHTVDRVLHPVTESLAALIDNDPQFSILRKLLLNTDLNKLLKEEGQTTLLAPTDAAFGRLGQKTLSSLIQGSSCVETILSRHILPNTICSTAIQGRMKTADKEGDYLLVERTDDDKLFAEGSQIIAKDLMATNGVMHIVDAVIVPEHAKPVKDVLAYHNVTKFIELLEEAELFAEIEENKDYAVFAPTNQAFDKIPAEEMQALRADKSKLRDFLRYHVSASMAGGNIINRNNELTDTVAKSPIRINFYSREPILNSFFNLERTIPVRVTAGCSRVSLLNSKACGAVVHVVEDVLRIPKEDVLASLDGDQYTMFRQMIKDVGYDTELSGDGPFTVFALSDHALRNIPEEELALIRNDNELKRKILDKHILKEHICCSGINSNNWLFMDRKRAMDGTTVHVRRTPYDQMMVGSARIVSCGPPSKNGIVHNVNRFVMSDRQMSAIMKGENPHRTIYFPDFTQIFRNMNPGAIEVNF